MFILKTQGRERKGKEGKRREGILKKLIAFPHRRAAMRARLRCDRYHPATTSPAPSNAAPNKSHGTMLLPPSLSSPSSFAFFSLAFSFSQSSQGPDTFSRSDPRKWSCSCGLIGASCDFCWGLPSTGGSFACRRVSSSRDNALVSARTNNRIQN